MSKEEQVELNKAIETIGSTIPVAIIQFDKYGKAIGISTDKAREFISLQQAILKEKNRSAIKEASGSLEELQKNLDVESGMLVSFKNKADQQFEVIETMRQNGLEPSKNAIEVMNILNKMVGNSTNKINELQTRIKGTKGIIDELNGTALAKNINDLPKPPVKDGTKTTDTATPTKKSDSDTQKEYERLKKEASDFQKELLKMQKEMEITDIAAGEAEIKRIEEKYKELLKRAVEYHQKHLTSDKDFATQQKLLSGLQTNEVTGIVAESDYKKSLEASDQYFDDKRKQAAKNYGDGITDEKGYQAALEQIEKDSDANKIVIHEGYVGYAKSAEANLIAAKKQSYEKDLANFVKSEEQKAKEAAEAAERAAALSTAEKIAGAELNISNSRPGSNNELAAKKRLLQMETDMKAEQL